MKYLKLMIFDMGNGNEIRFKLISRWLFICSSVSSKEGMCSKIEKYNPNAIILDFNLYEMIGGIEVARNISDRYEIPVWYE